MDTDIAPFLSIAPNVPQSAFIAPGAMVIGAVTLGEDASVWYGAVLRADIERITVGERTNIQDGTIIHLASDLGCHIGARVTCGHRAILHACTVEDEVLIGMGATVMDGARIGAGSIVAAGSLVTKGTLVPPGSLVVGAPARVTRPLTAAEAASIPKLAEKYVRVAARHREEIASGRIG